ncbi:DUF3037 domain-containing protein, partial [Enterobacter asburiae]|uniref:DUF3037 domain-containing protein n=1 Tax=Enterobacter asburiae TaxID=61645 RepID=UPI003D6FC871
MITFKYSLIRVTPSLEKGETINVGMIVYRDNEIDVRMINSVSKLRAIDKGLNLEYLEDLTSSFFDVSKVMEDIHLLPRLFKGSLSLSDFGVFTVSNMALYESKINELMARLVNPQRASHKRITRKIFFDIKETFVKNGIFGKHDEDLYHHKVVANYPISSDEGLMADFLLKNGKYHLTETIDFRSENVKKQMGDAAVSALPITNACEMFIINIDSFVIFGDETPA